DEDAHRFARQHNGLEGIGELVDVENFYALQSGDFVEIEIVGDDFRVIALGEFNELQVHFGDVLKIVLGDLDVQVVHFLDTLQNFQTATATLAAQRISGVSDHLEFAQDELRDDDCAVDEVGL